jgi:hypothetical protein
MLLVTLAVTAFISMGAVLAQPCSRHETVVAIPSVLRLRIGGDAFGLQASQPIDIQIGRSVATTDGIELEILSNVPWQLSVAYLPSRDEGGERLRWRSDGGAWIDLTRGQQTVGQGEHTGGWQRQPTEIAVNAGSLPDGDYRGTLVYILAQP